MNHSKLHDNPLQPANKFHKAPLGYFFTLHYPTMIKIYNFTTQNGEHHEPKEIFSKYSLPHK